VPREDASPPFARRLLGRSGAERRLFGHPSIHPGTMAEELAERLGRRLGMREGDAEQQQQQQDAEPTPVPPGSPAIRAVGSEGSPGGGRRLFSPAAEFREFSRRQLRDMERLFRQ